MHFEALIHTFRILDLIDILTVAIGIYYMYKLLKDTRAVALLKGLLFLAILNVLSHVMNLYVINWILQQGMTVILFALTAVKKSSIIAPQHQEKPMPCVDLRLL